MVFRAYFGGLCTHLVTNKLLSCFRFSFLIVMISMVTACSSGGGDEGGSGTVPITVSIQAVPGDGKNTITWSSVTGATSYNLYWSTSLDINVNNGTLIENANSGYSHSGLTNGTTYFYIVTATNSAGQSFASNIDRATPSAAILISSLTFTDANFAQCVNDNAATNGYVYIYDFIELNCDNKNISDITGIEMLTSLESLRLSGNLITDISPMANLTSLDFFYMSGLGDNDVSDLSPLGGLVNLTYLWFDLYYSPFVNTSPLSNLVHLEQLGLSFNGITDISFLANMSKLFWLDLIGNTSIADHSVIFTLTSLEVLKLSITNLTDISQLSSLTNLQALSISDNPIGDFSPLVSLSNLERFTDLQIGGTGISDISFLSNLSELIGLDISNNSISDISVLAGLDIYTLDIHNNNITDIAVLSGMSNLNVLSLGDNNISDFSVLMGMSSLSKFEASNSGLSNVNLLVNNTNLFDIRLPGNNIVSVSEFTKFSDLSFLVLDNNNIGGQGVGGVDQLSTLQSLFRVQIANNINMSCAELSSLISVVGSPPVDTDMNFSSVDSTVNGVNCTNP